MSIIEERAQKWMRENTPAIARGVADHAVKQAYIAGAESEREELLRWRDPKEDLPADLNPVLVKTIDPVGPYDIGAYNKDKEWWYGAMEIYRSDEIVGWRPIDEFE